MLQIPFEEEYGFVHEGFVPLQLRLKAHIERT